jgi:hypothetical protein
MQRERRVPQKRVLTTGASSGYVTLRSLDKDAQTQRHTSESAAAHAVRNNDLPPVCLDVREQEMRLKEG